jgi:hypothetical protein
MAAVSSDLENVLVGERELWRDGPPNELFAQMRQECRHRSSPAGRKSARRWSIGPPVYCQRRLPILAYYCHSLLPRLEESRAPRSWPRHKRLPT